jgi:two-component system chemotaxis response regulator CheB
MAYVAPEDYPLIAGPHRLLTLDDHETSRESFSAVDATLSALATRFGPAVLLVVLSGSGHDGIEGTLSVHLAGGTVIVQDAATCLAEETPRAIIAAGAATIVLPPEQIADEIARRVTRN